MLRNEPRGRDVSPGGEGPVCLAEAAFPDTSEDTCLPQLLNPTTAGGHCVSGDFRIPAQSLPFYFIGLSFVGKSAHAALLKSTCLVWRNPDCCCLFVRLLNKHVLSLPHTYQVFNSRADKMEKRAVWRCPKFWKFGASSLYRELETCESGLSALNSPCPRSCSPADHIYVLLS